MKSISNKIDVSTPLTPEEQMAYIIDKRVAQLKVQDEIYFETLKETGQGQEFEIKEFEVALHHYCAEDPVVAKKFKNYMQKMRRALELNMK